jgi:hypothetical protein
MTSELEKKIAATIVHLLRQNEAEYDADEFSMDGDLTTDQMAKAVVATMQKEVRGLVEALKSTQYHCKIFNDVNDYEDFSREERFLMLRNLLRAVDDSTKALATWEAKTKEGKDD